MLWGLFVYIDTKGRWVSMDKELIDLVNRLKKAKILLLQWKEDKKFR